MLYFAFDVSYGKRRHTIKMFSQIRSKAMELFSRTLSI